MTLFNGAFRRFDIFKANHPFRIQLMTLKKAVDEVESQGGTVDLDLEKHFPKIRAMYRYIILFGLTEKVSSLIGLEELIVPAGKAAAGIPIQLIASTNDPYIPLESIRQLIKDFPMQRVIELEYGHYPYSIDRSRILPLIEEFEKGATKPRAEKRRSPTRPKARHAPAHKETTASL